MLNIVLKITLLLWADFVLDWHVHWYLCTYMSLSDLSLQGDGDDDDDNTVFGLLFSTKLPYDQP